MFGVVVAALVAGAGAQVASPLVVRAFLDLARTGAAVDRLVAVAALFVGVAVAGSALEVLRSHAGAVLAWHAMNALRHRLFRHTIDLGHSFFARTAPGSLLERMIEMQDGDIRLGGVSVRELAAGHLRHRVAVLPQETEIVPGSVRDNVALFDDAVPAAAVADAFRRLGAEAWLQRLADGVETAIGPGGRELSSGERQLVAIARILLREPSVVILDEPAARIDPATEALVRRALAQLLRGRTGLVIAHRRTTLDLVDEVALLEHGAIAERIPRADLEAGAPSRIRTFLAQGELA